MAIYFGLTLSTACRDDASPSFEPAFADVTRSAGLERFTPTFGAVFSDIDGDGVDDIIVSNHANGPAIYLQKDTFVEAKDALPEILGDSHGITVADLDDDGDRDLVLACGGDDGVGPGCTARVFSNRLEEEGRLGFVEVSEGSGLAELPEHRSRHFLPTASADGSRIDLYLTGLKRPGVANRYYRNVGDDGIRFTPDVDSMLSEAYATEGRDALFDVDRDGDRDLLLIDSGTLRLFERTDSGFVPRTTALETIERVTSVGVGDLDNDGFPDLFVGTSARNPRADRIAHDASRIHFFVSQHELETPDETDGIRFETDDERILIDFVVKPGLQPNDASTIFLGESKENPWNRRSRIPAVRAEGEPAIDGPGTYIWHDADSGTWHVVWRYGNGETEERGSIHGSGITNVTPIDLETFDPVQTTDVILWNDAGKDFVLDPEFRLEHPASTVAARLDDLDNDGDLDVVGLRANPPGAYNAEPFLLVNDGDRRLRATGARDLKTGDDDLYMADQLTTGFANDDGLVDVFVTHGAGLHPGNGGPYKLFLNVTDAPHHYVILDLKGTRSNRDALGAQIELRDRAKGGLLGYRELGLAFHRSQPTHKIHFGLGASGGEVTAHIRWPSGIESEHDVDIDRITVVTEPES